MDIDHTTWESVYYAIAENLMRDLQAVKRDSIERDARHNIYNSIARPIKRNIQFNIWMTVSLDSFHHPFFKEL